MAVPPRLRSASPCALVAALLAVAALLGAVAPSAHAAPPPNDAPSAAGFFEFFTTKTGQPNERQAVADLFEATPDGGVPPCLGKGTFRRTVWYRLPGTPDPREVKIEANGRTTDVVDLAAFVQPGAPNPPLTKRPNACSGLGVGGDDITEEKTTALRVRVPPYYSVLVQVGRRGPAQAPEDEQVVLSAVEYPTLAILPPNGDRAGKTTPRIPKSGRTRVLLGGATTTEEDPAVPRCPSLGGVWRKVRVPATGRWTLSAVGSEAVALSAFIGSRPRAGTFVDCVDREGNGALVLPVKAKRRRQLWVRIGTDRPFESARATLRMERAQSYDFRSGGSCLAGFRPRISGTVAGDRSVRVGNRVRSIGLVLRATAGSPICTANLELVGPGGKVYARGFVPELRRARRTVQLRRVRRLRPGVYRLRGEAAAVGGVRGTVRSTVRFGLR